jgi:hypothetical protein
MAKRYTQAEWARIQAKLPVEDREPYSASPDVVEVSTKPTIDPYYVRDPKTGLSQAQVDAQKALQEAQDARTALNLPGKIVSKPGSAGQLSTPPTEGLKTGYEWYAFNLPGGGFEWRQKPTAETLKKSYTTLFSGGDNTGGGNNSGGGKTVTGTYTDPITGDVYLVYSDGSRVLQAKGTKQADAALAAQQAAQAAAEEKRRQGQSAYNLLFSEFERYGLGSLVKPLQEFIVEGLSPAEFTLRLRETDAYKKRFAANAQRINKGLRALSEAEYITLEDQYQNVMRNYGLPASYYARGDMGVQQGFEKFIAGDVSAAELEDRIQTAQNRVINAAPEVATSLREFYPEITGGDILAYALDPDKALTEIRRKVGAAEIGAGAKQAGLATGLARAEELQRYGVTAEQARQGFQTIGSLRPRASQLGDIYAKQGMGPFTQTTAEAEIFGTPGAVEAAAKRRKLTELETAQFSGTSGATGGALGRERAGQF